MAFQWWQQGVPVIKELGVQWHTDTPLSCLCGASCQDMACQQPVTNRQSIASAKITAALRWLQSKSPGVLPHLVTNSESVW